MLTVEKKDHRSVVVSGPESEVMTFYFGWQSKLWPDWIDHKRLGKEGDFATNQHKFVLEQVLHGNPIRLCSAGPQFQDAVDYATERCRLLGIKFGLPHQQRVIDEKLELDAKAKKLSDFIGNSETFAGLDHSEQDRLREQCEVMWRYSKILGQRIEAFDSVVPSLT